MRSETRALVGFGELGDQLVAFALKGLDGFGKGIGRGGLRSGGFFREGHAAGHAEMHHPRLVAVQPDQQPFRPPADANDPPPGQPLGRLVSVGHRPVARHHRSRISRQGPG